MYIKELLAISICLIFLECLLLAQLQHNQHIDLLHQQNLQIHDTPIMMKMVEDLNENEEERKRFDLFRTTTFV